MNRPVDRTPILGPRALVTGVIALAVGAAIIDVGLLDPFDHASSEHWLRPTPPAPGADAACGAVPACSGRARCAQALVARTPAASARPGQAAARC